MRCICLLIACVLLSSCAHSQTQTTESDDIIKKTLDKKVHFYQKKEKEKFFKNISKEYYPNYKEFIYDVEDFLYTCSNIHLEFKIEKVLTDKQSKSVDANWDKTYVDRQGNPVKLDGFTTLIFDVSGDEPLLINIKGDNPFTQ